MSDKHPDQPASPDSIQGLTSCYTKKQSFGDKIACQHAHQLQEKAKHQPPEYSLRLHLQEQKGLFSLSKVNFPLPNQNDTCWPTEISPNPESRHNFSQLTSAQREVNKETKCK